MLYGNGSMVAGGFLMFILMAPLNFFFQKNLIFVSHKKGSRVSILGIALY
jgi:hypothetical protein